MTIAILSSSNGTYLNELFEYIKSLGINIIFITNKEDCLSFKKAKENNIESYFISPKNKSKIGFDEEILKICNKNRVKEVFLIGYLKILTNKFIKAFINHIYNIHPSLLPAFSGGMDLNVHEEVIKKGCRVSGATLHIATEQLDNGPIIDQDTCRIEKNETPTSLKSKVQKIEIKIIKKLIKSLTYKKIETFKKPLIKNISVPSSKSITNRILPLSIFSKKNIIIKNPLNSEDGNIMKDALIKMGVEIIQLDEKRISIKNKKFFTNTKDLEIFCGNSGTTIRFLTAISILRKGKTILTGINAMKKRPIKDLVNSLKSLDIKINYKEEDGYPPLEIFPLESISNKKNQNHEVFLSGNKSSQFFTALFLLAPQVGLNINVKDNLVSIPYIELTISLLKKFGVTIINKNYKKFIINKQNIVLPSEIEIEGDASSASYPLSIGLITKGEVSIKNIPKDSFQGDNKFKEIVIDKMKGENELLPLGNINLEDIPDSALSAIVLCAYANGYSKIMGLSTLRHKECDRLYAMEINLKNMGIKINTGKDYIEIWGNPNEIHGAEIECFNDHRIAMSFAILGTVVESVIIKDPKCVNKTYPSFWKDLEKWSK
jgi:3-phosphoshikimate 1-carboxyvinyltransferase